MIAGLSGQLLTKLPTSLILDVHGVGYQVHIPLSTYFALPQVRETVSLKIHTHLREDTIQLFGFLTTAEKEAFVMLIGLSGVGGRLALNILSTLSVPDLTAAIQQNDLDCLTSVPGIGKKSASRMILELKDRINQVLGGEVAPSTLGHRSPEDRLQDDAVSALVNLGYRAKEVNEAIAHTVRAQATNVSLDELIRETLKALSGR